MLGAGGGVLEVTPGCPHTHFFASSLRGALACDGGSFDGMPRNSQSRKPKSNGQRPCRRGWASNTLPKIEKCAKSVDAEMHSGDQTAVVKIFLILDNLHARHSNPGDRLNADLKSAPYTQVPVRTKVKLKAQQLSYCAG